jgi:hypothetical protein
MPDAGEAIALAAVVDLITSVHFELQDGFLSLDGVGDAFGRGGSCVWHFRQSVAAVAIIATAPRRRFGGRVGEQPFHIVEPSSLRPSLPRRGS